MVRSWGGGHGQILRMGWWAWSDPEDGGDGHGQILRMGGVDMVRS